MSQPRLCEVKDELISICLKLTREAPYHIPHFRYAIDELRCPSAGHCNPNGPCQAWKDGAIRQRVSKIEGELFRLGFVKTDETFGEEHK